MRGSISEEESVIRDRWYALQKCSWGLRWAFFCPAEDGIRDLVRSGGLGEVYKRRKRYLSGMFVVQKRG